MSFSSFRWQARDDIFNSVCLSFVLFHSPHKEARATDRFVFFTFPISLNLTVPSQLSFSYSDCNTPSRLCTTAQASWDNPKKRFWVKEGKGLFFSVTSFKAPCPTNCNIPPELISARLQLRSLHWPMYTLYSTGRKLSKPSWAWRSWYPDDSSRETFITDSASQALCWTPPFKLEQGHFSLVLPVQSLKIITLCSSHPEDLPSSWTGNEDWSSFIWAAGAWCIL